MYNAGLNREKGLKTKPLRRAMPSRALLTPKSGNVFKSLPVHIVFAIKHC